MENDHFLIGKSSCLSSKNEQSSMANYGRRPGRLRGEVGVRFAGGEIGDPQQSWVILGANVGKYSSTMEHMGWLKQMVFMIVLMIMIFGINH